MSDGIGHNQIMFRYEAREHARIAGSTRASILALHSAYRMLFHMYPTPTQLSGLLDTKETPPSSAEVTQGLQHQYLFPWVRYIISGPYLGNKNFYSPKSLRPGPRITSCFLDKLAFPADKCNLQRVRPAAKIIVHSGKKSYNPYTSSYFRSSLWIHPAWKKNSRLPRCVQQASKKKTLLLKDYSELWSAIILMDNRRSGHRGPARQSTELWKDQRN